MFGQVFSSLRPIVDSPVIPLDVPGIPAPGALRNYMNLSDNPATSGSAVAHFGLERLRTILR